MAKVWAETIERMHLSLSFEVVIEVTFVEVDEDQLGMNTALASSYCSQNCTLQHKLSHLLWLR